MALQSTELSADDARSHQDIYPLLRTLRPTLTRAAFDSLLTEGAEQGLHVLAARDEQERCLGVALYRVQMTSRGRILFIDDLVTATESRSSGLGTMLLTELEQRGYAAGCDRIELDSGVTNQAAHRFYHRHRMEIRAFHFAKPLETR